MWVVALLGGASAFIESALAQVYKKKDGKGGCVGGPSYYMEQALHQRWLGVIFAVVLILTYVVGYNMLASYNLQDAFAGFGFYARAARRTSSARSWRCCSPRACSAAASA